MTDRLWQFMWNTSRFRTKFSGHFCGWNVNIQVAYLSLILYPEDMDGKDLPSTLIYSSPTVEHCFMPAGFC